ncbi:NAD-dependent protein deacylase [bacterium HR39]|nr:NAD-dependent protein deacylase [bacterium HR39]
MHGELLRVKCTACGRSHPRREDVTRESACPACGRTGTLRPDVVWFGEVPYHLDAIYDALTRCRLFVAVGTSGQVHPAAGFVEVAKANGALTVELNLEPSAVSYAFDIRRYGPASEVVPAFVDGLLTLSGVDAG